MCTYVRVCVYVCVCMYVRVYVCAVSHLCWRRCCLLLLRRLTSVEVLLVQKLVYKLPRGWFQGKHTAPIRFLAEMGGRSNANK